MQLSLFPYIKYMFLILNHFVNKSHKNSNLKELFNVRYYNSTCKIISLHFYYTTTCSNYEIILWIRTLSDDELLKDFLQVNQWKSWKQSNYRHTGCSQNNIDLVRTVEGPIIFIMWQSQQVAPCNTIPWGILQNEFALKVNKNEVTQEF